jgi:hypothetical protein
VFLASAQRMPSLACDEFHDLALRFVRELGESADVATETIDERRVRIEGDPNATLTRRASVVGTRTIVLEETRWKEPDVFDDTSFSRAVGAIADVALGVTLELTGDLGTLRAWRVTGADAASATPVEATWRAFMARVVRERLRWREAATPAEWMTYARSLDPLRDVSEIEPLECLPPSRLLRIDRAGVPWLFAGALTLDAAGSELRVIGPAPLEPWRGYVFTGEPRSGASWIRPDPPDLARIVVADASWTLVEQATRDVHTGEWYGLVDRRSAGWREPRGAVIGSEHTRTWRSGSWVMRHSQITSSAFASSFELAVQSIEGGKAALFALGSDVGNALGETTSRPKPTYVVRLLAHARGSLARRVEAIERHVRAHGWDVHVSREPKGRPTATALAPAERQLVHDARSILDALKIPMSKEQVAEFDALSAKFVAAIRAGGSFGWSSIDEWDLCSLVDGAITWSSSSGRLALATDDAVIVQLLTGGQSFRVEQRPSAILDALRDAVRTAASNTGGR